MDQEEDKNLDCPDYCIAESGVKDSKSFEDQLNTVISSTDFIVSPAELTTRLKLAELEITQVSCKRLG